MIRKICAVSAAVLLLGAVPCATLSTETKQASAYSLVNGEKSYSIAADRIMYQTERAFDKTINTFEAWIKLPGALADSLDGGVIFGNYYNKPTGYAGCVNFEVAQEGKFKIYWDNGAYEYTFDTVDLRNDEWTHIALVRDKQENTLTYYVNGEKEEELGAVLGESVCDMNFGVGCDWDNWYNEKRPFYGKIRQITLYSEAVSAETVASDMNTQTITDQNRPDSGLMANWNFTEKWGNEEIVYDQSPEQNNCKRATYDCYVPVEEVDDYDYSFAVVPDMQAMNYCKPDNFRQQSQWFVDNVDDVNLKFVMYLGDMTESRYIYNPESSENEWKLVRECYSMLDGVVPYTFILGNHDYDNWGTSSRDTTLFDVYLPYAKYSQTNYFGGAFKEGDMDNTYSIIPVGDIEYLIFSLEYGPRPTVLNWADRIMSEHPDSRVIVTSHCIVNPDGTFSTNSKPSAASRSIKYESVNDGDQIWEKLMSKHSNMFMSFSGHIPTDQVIMRTDTGVNGNQVRSVLINAQGAMMTSAMNTFLLVKVNERTKTMNFCYYSPEYDACYNEQGQFSFSFADENNPTVGGAEEEETANVSLEATAPAALSAGIGGSAMCAVLFMEKGKGGKKREKK